MKTNNYESVVIINAALEDEQIKATIGRIGEALLTNGAETTDVEDWGRRRLAYPIQKAKSGYYYIVRYTAPPSSISKIERFFFLEETIIRYLTVKLDKKAMEYYKNKKKDETKSDATNE
ncbi:MAG: 30S ribosomal protein S6 [Ignavibacteria bacterium]|nr:MAG: 30S ribosomal protein S6 [Ignavibacteria bacterium]